MSPKQFCPVELSAEMEILYAYASHYGSTQYCGLWLLYWTYLEHVKERADFKEWIVGFPWLPFFWDPFIEARQESGELVPGS